MRFLLLGICSFVCLDGEARGLSVLLESDSVEIGQLIRFTASEPLPPVTEVLTPVWEMVSCADEAYIFQIFQPGSHDLPTLMLASGMEIQLEADLEFVVVSLPASVERRSVPDPIAGPIELPQPWWEGMSVGVSVAGAVLWMMILLIARIKSVGPAFKRPPPPSELARIRGRLEEVTHLTDPDQKFSAGQALFRDLLYLIGIPDARSVPLDDVLAAGRDLPEEHALRQVLDLIRTADSFRFGGQTVSDEGATQLIEQIQHMSRNISEEDILRQPDFEQMYGTNASPIARMIAGLLDQVPILILMTGLLAWPELQASLPWIPDGAGELFLAAGCLSLLIRAGIEWLGITSIWQASPGMRCMNLAVVTTGNRLWMRPWLSMIASGMMMMGHLGMFRPDRLSIPDRVSQVQIRSYSGKI